MDYRLHAPPHACAGRIAGFYDIASRRVGPASVHPLRSRPLGAADASAERRQAVSIQTRSA